VKDVTDALRAWDARSMYDARVGFRYVATVASKLAKLQGGLLLSFAATATEAPADPTPVKLRSIA
jgi:hypothetical protein